MDDRNQNFEDHLSKYKSFKGLYQIEAMSLDKCPVCEKSNLEFFHKNIHRANYPNFFVADDNLLVCGTCGTIMADTVYPPSYYFRYINEFYDVIPPAIVPDSYIRPVIRKKYLEDTLLRISEIPRSILEVSSFDGTTLHILGDFGSKVFGVEPTTGAHELAAASFPQFSGRLINAVFEDCGNRLPDEKFDLIIFSQSLRQIADPLGAMQIVDDHISDDGFLLIDEGSFLEHMLTCPVTEIPYNLFTEKNFYYSQNGLLHMLERFGFEYVSHTHSHALQGVSATRRYALLLLKRNKNLMRDNSLIAKSKQISDTLISSFRSNWDTPEKTLQQIKDTQTTAG